MICAPCICKSENFVLDLTYYLWFVKLSTYTSCGNVFVIFEESAKATLSRVQSKLHRTHVISELSVYVSTSSYVMLDTV